MVTPKKVHCAHIKSVFKKKYIYIHIYFPDYILLTAILFIQFLYVRLLYPSSSPLTIPVVTFQCMQKEKSREKECQNN